MLISRMRKDKPPECRLLMLVALLMFFTIVATSCGSTGLTSIEAAELAFAQAQRQFKDAVLWRMIPAESAEPKIMSVLADWQKSDRSAAWMIWFADPLGENWLIYNIQGLKITKQNIGTRGSKMAMSSDWPRKSTTVSMKDAMSAAVKNGANPTAIIWAEYICNFTSSDFRNRPIWIFSFSETLSTGTTINYRLFVDAMTGIVGSAINDRGDKLTLPLNSSDLLKPRTESHVKDLNTFFSFIINKDPIWAVRQLSFKMSPNETVGQQWLSNFQSIQSLKIVSIEQTNLEQWTSSWESYKVVMDIQTSEKPEKFGWDDGRNIRWVSLVPQGGGAWKVDTLSSNP